MGELRAALAHSRCSMSVGWLCDTLDGREPGPKEQAQGTVLGKSLVAVGMGHLLSVLFAPHPTMVLQGKRWSDLSYLYWRCLAQSQA